jgi:hypothetical protein
MDCLHHIFIELREVLDIPVNVCYFGLNLMVNQVQLLHSDLDLHLCLSGPKSVIVKFDFIS